MQIKDDWKKPRSTSQHLTEAEIAKMRVAFNCGRRPRDIARELKCSSRVAATYYAKFRNNTSRKAPIHMVEVAPTPPAPKSRFYKSNFEL